MHWPKFDNSQQNRPENLQTNPPKIRKTIMYRQKKHLLGDEVLSDIETLCSDCGTDGKWARALGGSLAHAMNTLLGLVSVCGPCPHCCPMILDILALRT